MSTVTKQRDPEAGQQSLLFQVCYQSLFIIDQLESDSTLYLRMSNYPHNHTHLLSLSRKGVSK